METAVAENYDTNPDTNPAFVQGGNLDIPAFGGPMGIRWDEGARVTPWGGFAYFATFLRTSGLFDRLVADAPFEYASPNAPAVRDVVGTAVLAILADFTRYCHVERLRNDTACAALLGLTKVVSDESLRRGLKRCEEASPDWRDCGCGWEAMDTVIRLDGWTKSRRCVLVRRPAEEKPEARPAKRPRGRPRKNAPVGVRVRGVREGAAHLGLLRARHERHVARFFPLA